MRADSVFAAEDVAVVRAGPAVDYLIGLAAQPAPGGPRRPAHGQPKRPLSLNRKSNASLAWMDYAAARGIGSGGSSRRPEFSAQGRNPRFVVTSLRVRHRRSTTTSIAFAARWKTGSRNSSSGCLAIGLPAIRGGPTSSASSFPPPPMCDGTIRRVGLRGPHWHRQSDDPAQTAEDRRGHCAQHPPHPTLLQQRLSSSGTLRRVCVSAQFGLNQNRALSPACPLEGVRVSVLGAHENR